ncbi:hypothetical protein B0H14DRAFT_3521094 [Mycena olivaceomarginata]|nr:hypothetical protein B0H14DRAFT_3521094 [Mycena olivaceomarginata]
MPLSAAAWMCISWTMIQSTPNSRFWRHLCYGQSFSTMLRLKNVFRFCGTIEPRALRAESRRGPEGLDVPDITLLSLRSLTLTGRLVTGYLETLVVPALHDLEIPESFIAPNSIDTLTSFMSKSHCKLQRLCITRRWSGSRDPFYKAFPLIAVSFETGCDKGIRTHHSFGHGKVQFYIVPDVGPGDPICFGGGTTMSGGASDVGPALRVRPLAAG